MREAKGKRQSILDKHQTFDFKAMKMANLSPSSLHSTKTQWSEKNLKVSFWDFGHLDVLIFLKKGVTRQLPRIKKFQKPNLIIVLFFQ